jgi:hypothetical protein
VNSLLAKRPKNKLKDKLNKYKRSQKLRNASKTQLKRRRSVYK